MTSSTSSVVSESSKAGSPVVVTTAEELRPAVAAARRDWDRIGFVPTMGALHEGHLSLVRAARQECDFVVVSIFVNPTQFGPKEDLSAYPRPLESDLAHCASEGVDLAFVPEVEEIYPPGFSTYVRVEGLDNVLEGQFRPGHFRGVATVVLKLFSVVAPDVAYFGHKDYQQSVVIRRMVRDMNLPLEVRVRPTVREPDGLACSSRNRYLGPEDRQRALALYRSLTLAKELIEAGERDANTVRQQMHDLFESTHGVSLDYATLVDPETLEEVTSIHGPTLAAVAARVGKARLIDNMLITT